MFVVNVLEYVEGRFAALANYLGVVQFFLLFFSFLFVFWLFICEVFT